MKLNWLGTECDYKNPGLKGNQWVLKFSFLWLTVFLFLSTQVTDLRWKSGENIFSVVFFLLSKKNQKW